MRKIDLRDIPVIYMNLEQHTEKDANMRKILFECGFKTILRIEGVARPDNPIAGCSSAHHKTLMEIDPPFIIFEDDCQIGNNTIFANNTTLGGHVEVGDYVIFGGFSGAHQFCKIGAHSFLGMYSGVARDLPPYIIVMGQPAEPRGINLEGIKRRDFSEDQIRNIKSAYKALYMSDLRLEEATKSIQDLGDINGEINILVDFLRNTTRGIVRKG